jgi:hypothetical protein
MTPTRELVERARERYQNTLEQHQKVRNTATLASLQLAEDRYVAALLEWSDSCGLVVRLPHLERVS